MEVLRQAPRPAPPPVSSVQRASPPRPTPLASRQRPDPNPTRFMVGLAAIASASAIATVMLSGIVPNAPDPVNAVAIVDVPSAAPAKHVTRYVQLKPGETAPPQAVTLAAPKPTPRVVVVTTTRQSGRP